MSTTRSMRPGLGVITQIRLESWIASSMLWVTKTTVGLVSIHRNCRSRRIASRVIASSLPSGSSSSSIFGSCTRVWQKAARCCMPPDSSNGSRFSKPPRCTELISLAIREAKDEVASPRSSSCSSMLPRTVRHGTSVLSWNMMPISVRGSATVSPSMRISPAVGGSSPATISIRVDLPQPEGPSSETNSPPVDGEVGRPEGVHVAFVGREDLAHTPDGDCVRHVAIESRKRPRALLRSRRLLLSRPQLAFRRSARLADRRCADQSGTCSTAGSHWCRKRSPACRSADRCNCFMSAIMSSQSLATL